MVEVEGRGRRRRRTKKKNKNKNKNKNNNNKKNLAFSLFTSRTHTGTNVLCGACAPGYSRVGQNCEDCSHSKASGNWLLFILGSLAWVVFLVFIAAFQGPTAKKKIMFYFMQTLGVVLGPASSW